jgi:hypothetical protein
MPDVAARISDQQLVAALHIQPRQQRDGTDRIQDRGIVALLTRTPLPFPTNVE